MAFLHETEVRHRARTRARRFGVGVPDELRSIARERSAKYDIFLSQTIRDAEIVLGVYDLLTDLGYVVFCDWIDAPEADRNEVSPENAKSIRQAMSRSDTLLFLDSDGADQSLWMCWELGWFDGTKGPVAVLPVLPDSENFYRGREFLGLYPYVELDDRGGLKIVRPIHVGRRGIALIESPNSRSYENWRTGGGDYMRPRVF